MRFWEHIRWWCFFTIWCFIVFGIPSVLMNELALGVTVASILSGAGLLVSLVNYLAEKTR
jgi:hypothetical protein